MIRVLIGIGIGVVALVGIVGLGLQIPAKSFAVTTRQKSAAQNTDPLTPLPAPVKRFHPVLFPDGMPRITSALVQGRGRIAPTGLPMPARFQFYYDTEAVSYYHLRL